MKVLEEYKVLDGGQVEAAAEQDDEERKRQEIQRQGSHPPPHQEDEKVFPDPGRGFEYLLEDLKVITAPK